MLKRKNGLIINIEDVAAYRPYRGYSPYLTAKAGVTMLTRILALELAPHIRVCGVAPGAVMFPKGYSAAKKKRALKNVPLARAGSPEDISSIVTYLAVEGNYINGSTIFVDGGRNIAT
jgi:pteridine reductase